MSQEIQTVSKEAEEKNRLPPKLVDDVQHDIEAIRPLVRGIAAVHLYDTYKRVMHPNASLKDKLDFQTIVNKMAGVDVKSSTEPVGPSFSVTINIPNSDKSVTVEGTSVRLEEPDDEAGNE
jgi:hypothetical protein